MNSQLDTLQVQTTRFGTLQVDAQKVIAFPRGLYGFEAMQRFLLLPHDDDGVFFWLQAVDDGALAMLVTNPFVFFPDYAVNLADADAAELRADQPQAVSVFTILTILRQPERVTANLLGPVVINAAARIGMQVALQEERYTTRVPLPSAAGN